jgi:hypothetical protein
LFFKYFPPSVYAGRPQPFVALDANTGAIAVTNKSLQIRYPDPDDEKISQVKPSWSHFSLSYNQNTTTKVATIPTSVIIFRKVMAVSE